MKIVHLVGWYFPDSVGGTEIYVDGLCRRLIDAGFDIRIAAPRVCDGATAHYEHHGVPVFRYPIPDRPSRDEAYHRIGVRGSDRLYTWLAAERPDILHVHSFTTGVGLPEVRAAVELGIRVVVTCHLPGFGYMCRTGELMQWGRTPCDGIVEPAKCAACNLTRLGMAKPVSAVVGAIPVRLSRGLRTLPGRLGTTLGMGASVEEYERHQHELFSLVERFVILNETARRMLMANGAPPSKLVLNRLGITFSHVRENAIAAGRPARRPVRFGYVGRLHPSKGLNELAAAVSRVPREVDFTVEIRGPGLDEASRRYAARLRQLLDGEPRVSFGPGVTAERVASLLASFDALVIPSVCFENGPTVALEAMAAGTPVIASRVGNLSEIVQDCVNGRLVPAGDVPALAAALADAASRPAETIESWRRRLVTPRTMDDVTRDYVALYAA